MFVCSLFSIFATFVKKTILRNSYSLVMLKCKCSYYYILLILIQNCSNTLISKGCEICKTNHSREKKIHGWLCWWSILYDTTIKTQFFLANFRTIKVIICIKLFCLPLISIKVHIFWEGHKILRNLHQLFAKFCGLLRIYEL